MDIHQDVIFNLYTELVEDTLDDNNKDTFFSNLQNFINKYAGDLNVGRQEIISLLPKNIFSSKSKENYTEIYNCGTFNDNKIVHTYNLLSDTDFVKIISYPLEGEFTKDQQDAIKFIGGIFFTYFSRFLYKEYIKESYKIDSMTSAPNFVGIMESAEEIKNRYGTLSNYSCLFLNIRDFKIINAEFGAVNGNLLLSKYYFTLDSFFVDDEVCARLGGDNFVILLKNDRLDFFLNKIDNISFTVNMPDGEHSVNMNARVGIYMVGEDDDFLTAIQRASIANSICKMLKESNTFFYTDDITMKFNVEQQIVLNFKEAISNKEFCVFYQPKVDTKTRQIVGAEALVRWYKDKRFIPPINFIPVLEKKGLIHELDLFIFESVCQDIQNFLNEGITPVKVSINLSRNDLQDERLFDTLKAIMDKYGISEDFIEVEITESSMYDNPVILSNFIHKLNDSNISVSVDDFGTGYSSLMLIKDYHFDIIKIDKSFIDSIKLNDIKSLMFLQNIVKLLKDLDIKVVAEGVESLEQLEYLKNIGCDIIQGYVFDKPLPLKEFKKRLLDEDYYQ